MPPQDEEEILEKNRGPSPVFGLPGMPAPGTDVKPSLSLIKTIQEAYFLAVDNPTRLPSILHPIINREREIDLSGKRTYLSPVIYLADHMGVRRTIYLNFQLENLIFGGAGAVAVGVVTPRYFVPDPAIVRTTSRLWLRRSKDGSGFHKFVASAMIATRVVKRLFLGAVAYDLLKRNMEKTRGQDNWLAAGGSGALLGTAFGLRGGLPTTILGGFGLGLFATLHNLYTNMKWKSEDDDD